MHKNIYFFLVIVLFIIFILWELFYNNKLFNKEVLDIMKTEQLNKEFNLVDGGPGKDGIPSIDNPQYVNIEQAKKFLKGDDMGVVISFQDLKRFYPFSILVWHEIVNDQIKDKKFLITYCPLCRSAVVFDPFVKGRYLDFGVSGKLWNSNLVMYDRQTNSLWSQILGEAIEGELKGTRLKILPYDIMKFRDWARNNPDGEVLSLHTGFSRPYGKDPYLGYYSKEILYFPVDIKDSRLLKKDLILGIESNGLYKAYLLKSLKNKKIYRDVFNKKEFIFKYNKDNDTVHVFIKKDNKLVKYPYIISFWFSWVAAHPQTNLFK